MAAAQVLGDHFSFLFLFSDYAALFCGFGLLSL